MCTLYRYSGGVICTISIMQVLTVLYSSNSCSFLFIEEFLDLRIFCVDVETIEMHNYSIKIHQFYLAS